MALLTGARPGQSGAEGSSESHGGSSENLWSA